MDNQKNTDIRINKRMRMWNRYRNLVIGFGGILVLILVITIIFKGCDRASSSTKEKESTTAATKTEETVTNATNSNSITNQILGGTQAGTQAAQVTNKVYTTTKTLAKEDITSAEFFSRSIFLGDAIANGIEYYGFLGDDRVISATNMTTDKATDYVAEVVAAAPEKVFIMLGINDLNYGARTTDTIASNYAKLIEEIKSKLPGAKIYIVSVLPITKEYESKANVYIRKTNLDDLNNKLKGLVNSSGVDFIDAAPVFSDATGYLNSGATSNGLNITSGYYGFLLNTIADMLK